MEQGQGMGLEGQPYTAKIPDPAYLHALHDFDYNTRRFNTVMKTFTDISTEMVKLLKRVADATEEQNELLKLQRPRGKVYPINLTMPISPNAKLVHIDFITGDKDSILPPNTNLNYPYAKLYWINITNDGPGTIFYATNEAKNSVQGYTKLLASESDPLGPYLFPTFETMNIVLENAAVSGASVRIRTLA